MIALTSTDLRNNAKKYLDLVEKGQEFEIYRNGKPIAILAPHQKQLRNRWKTAEPLDLGGVSLSRLILEERSEE